MKLSKQWFVTYYYPGAFFAETAAEPVDAPNPSEIKLPSNSYGFYFYYKEYIEIEGKRKYLEGEKGKTGVYYTGKKYSTQDLMNLFQGNGHETLVLNSKNTGYVVQTHIGNWQIFHPDKDHMIGGGA